MRYFKIIPIAGVFDPETRIRISRALHLMKLNVGEEFGRKGCKNFFRIDKIEKVDDGRVFTLTDRRSSPYVFKVLNGYLFERIERGELKETID